MMGWDDSHVPLSPVVVTSGAFMDKYQSSPKPTFIDLFSGCGGLSLGLTQAGWQGIFAIERASDAFETFKANFLETQQSRRFLWPAWLEQSAHSIDDVLEKHKEELGGLRGRVDLIAGGPPCQGFSFAGKRNAADPRNKMFERYVSFVDIIRPKYLVLENVPGMQVAHAGHGNSRRNTVGQTYYEKLIEALQAIGYVAKGRVLDASNFGVPQRRARLVVIGMRNDIAEEVGAEGCWEAKCDHVFSKIEAVGRAQLHSYGGGKPVTAGQAIADLVVGTGKAAKQRTIEYTGEGARKGYLQLNYEEPREKNAYLAYVRDGAPKSSIDSMRLAQHSEVVQSRFEAILDSCRRGVNLSSDDRSRFGILKHRTVPMSKNLVAPTLTTLPDDILHFKDPRILTVRECARLQSFPDWFVFKGKYTTGGARRRFECPRYTQVGNAVPPLLARAIGMGALEALHEASSTSEQSSVRHNHARTDVRRVACIGR